MIQRVQTLYLLLAAALVACALLLPVAHFFGEGEEVVLRAVEWWPLTVLLGLAAALLLVNIFTFKRRWLQLRLCFSGAVLTLGSQGFIIWYVLKIAADPAVVSWKMALPAVFPLVAFVLVVLAIRGVVNDDRLVKSLDRLR